MKPTNIVLLAFNSQLNHLVNGKKLSDGLSVVVQIGHTLWVANDETISLERLTLSEAESTHEGIEHRQFSLNDYLRLPMPPAANSKDLDEADLEGLAYEDGYLWLIGSHSLKRKQPKPDEGFDKSSKRLAIVEGDGNRYLLARIPVEKNNGTYVLTKKAKEKGEKRTAAQLNGDKNGNELLEALGKDDHLGPFLAIPGKDNGFDIEGLAAADGHLFIGLRGPVLRGWAIILEVVPEEDKDDSAKLKLKSIGSNGRPYRKHFLQLGGLGVRDLCVQGDNLLILAGPTMVLDGPVAVFRWPGGAKTEQESMVSADKLERLLDIPYGEGVDHAEGLSLFSIDGSEAHQIIIVYDSASKSRRPGENTMLADVFTLPAA